MDIKLLANFKVLKLRKILQYVNHAFLRNSFFFLPVTFLARQLNLDGIFPPPAKGEEVRAGHY